MKYFSMIIIVLLSISCVKKNSIENRNMSAIEIIEMDERLLHDNQNFELLDLQNTNNHKENMAYVPKQHMGIYLPTKYIEALMETRSHIEAAKKQMDQMSFLIIQEDSIGIVYNFWEGTRINIIEISDNEIILEYDGENNIYIIDNHTVKNKNNTLFTKICESNENVDYTISSYIAKIIFGKGKYRNDSGEELYMAENGDIIYKDIAYNLSIYIFIAKYDLLSTNRKIGKHMFFKMNNDILNIFQIINTEEDYNTILYEREIINDYGLGENEYILIPFILADGL